MGDDSADKKAHEEALRHAAKHDTLEEVTRLIAAGTNIDATGYVRIILISVCLGHSFSGFNVCGDNM